MKKILYILPLLLLFSCIDKEENVNYINTYLFDGEHQTQGYVPKIIDGIPEEYYELYYREDYSSKSNGWWIGNETSVNNVTISASVSNGHYNLYQNSHKYANWINMVSNFPTIDLETTDSFDFKIKYKYRNTNSSNVPSDFYGFYAKHEPNTICNIFSIKINQDQKFYASIGEYNRKGDWVNWDSKQVTNLKFNIDNQTSEYNEVLFRKINYKFYLFLNGELVNVVDRGYSNKTGNRFGFIVSNTNVAIDEIEIKKIIRK